MFKFVPRVMKTHFKLLTPKSLIMKKHVLVLSILTSSVFSTFAQERIDADAMAKIRNEGFQNSKVMDFAFQLTDVNGPRLTNSPGYNKAANWAIKTMKEWGLVNAAMQPWGEFGKGWELKKSYVAMTAPYYKPLIAYPKTWTKGSAGLKNASVIIIKAKDSTELEQYRGKLKGKILVMDRSDTLKPSYKPDASRYTDEQLSKMASQTLDTSSRRPRTTTGRRMVPIATHLRNLALSEGALAILSTNPAGRDGTLFVSGGGGYAKNDPENPLDLMVAYEDYRSIVRLVNAGYPVNLDIDVKTQFQTKDLQGYNVFAEFTGSDPVLKNEIVMLGGHLDSWQASTGATDNAAGCAVMMEAIRILKESGLQPKRTIRIALWGGEEQGLHGSRNYVKNQLGDPATKEMKPEQSKISAYFNLDNGTGKIRGIYAQGNEAVMPIFTEWLKPFNDLDAKTVTIGNTGGTDHLSFDAIGIPGFQFIQEPMEYSTRTHHTNMDNYDHLSAADLQQAAVIVAAFVYNAATRTDMLPRKVVQ